MMLKWDMLFFNLKKKKNKKSMMYDFLANFVDIKYHDKAPLRLYFKGGVWRK